MSQPFTLTSELYDKVRSALSTRKMLLMKTSSFQKPMIDLLKGIVETQRDLDTEERDLLYLKIRIEETLQAITQYKAEKTNYEMAIGQLFGDYQVEQFIKTTNDEWARVNEKKTEDTAAVESVSE
jgi:hypothetical protein